MSHNKFPFPENANNRAEKAKKWLKIAPMVVAPFLLYVVLVPSYAYAGIFSFLSGPVTPADAETTAQSADSSGVLQAANSSQTENTLADSANVVDGEALVASSGVNGTIADIENSPANTAISLYVVRQGDSLSQIAKIFGVSVNTIIWANDITGPIQPGDELVILPITGVKYTVAKGDTIASIAKKLGADQGDIVSFNGLDPEKALVVGTELIIPDGELSSTAPIVLRQGKITDQNLPPEPAHNTNGPSYPGYYAMPLASACVSQGLHGYNAVDLAAPKYTPIYAVADGTVIVAKNNGAWNGGYGNYVVISHANGTQTLYAHMTKVLATQGESASQGEEIGVVGMTGEATGPHLHIEVRGAQNPFLNEYPSCY